MGYGTSPIELMAAEAMLKGQIYCEHFTYSAAFITGTPTALGATSSTEVQIQINGDSDFVMQEFNFTAETAAGTFLASADYLILLVVSGSGRQLMNQAQHIENLFGNFQSANNPHYLPMPKLIQASNVLSVTLTNRTAVAANRVDVAFIGFKVFYTGGSRQTIFHLL